MVAAVSWLQFAFLGTIATTVAIIAVSAVGFMMLAGRASVRHGAGVIVGSFMLFGASSIVAGIQSSVASPDFVSVSNVPPPPATTPQTTAPAVSPPPADDPYAAASVILP
ncbi:TrbC/VirB2 family protein [Allosphingosinicella sp.]|uniref:TrbC/VirB2 family protein n=1 Tax=Allosphingosinicella sp. TaxID=2823234 RepID=UPI002EE99850